MAKKKTIKKSSKKSKIVQPGEDAINQMDDKINQFIKSIDTKYEELKSEPSEVLAQEETSVEYGTQVVDVHEEIQTLPAEPSKVELARFRMEELHNDMESIDREINDVITELDGQKTSPKMVPVQREIPQRPSWRNGWTLLYSVGMMTRGTETITEMEEQLVPISQKYGIEDLKGKMIECYDKLEEYKNNLGVINNNLTTRLSETLKKKNTSIDEFVGSNIEFERASHKLKELEGDIAKGEKILKTTPANSEDYSNLRKRLEKLKYEKQEEETKIMKYSGKSTFLSNTITLLTGDQLALSLTRVLGVSWHNFLEMLIERGRYIAEAKGDIHALSKSVGFAVDVISKLGTYSKTYEDTSARLTRSLVMHDVHPNTSAPYFDKYTNEMIEVKGKGDEYRKAKMDEVKALIGGSSSNTKLL